MTDKRRDAICAINGSEILRSIEETTENYKIKLHKNEYAMAKKWLKDHFKESQNCFEGCGGADIEICFTPCTFCMGVDIRCRRCKKELDITDYDSF